MSILSFLGLPSVAEIRARWGSGRTGRRPATSRHARTYQAALPSNRTADWSMAQTSANSEIRRALRNLRARSRELQRNNGLVRKFIKMVGNNVVGPEGMSLSDAIEGEEDNARDLELNEEIIEAFNEWARPENASTSGKLSWADQQKLAIETMARDGEVLIRKRIANNPFGFALQFLDVAWLDETYSTILPNGNRVLMSVELDSLDRPVAYHLSRPSSDYLYAEYGSERASFRTRVPADEIYHLFIVTEHETQVRGVPWAHAVMEMLHTINGYVDAELYASRAGACVTDYLIPAENNEWNEFYEAKECPTADGLTPGAVRDLEVASQQVLPPGWKVESNDPKHPNTNFEAFLIGAERYVASGLDVPYFRLASDLNGVNYTSSRAGDNEARDVYRLLQRWLRDHLCRRVFFDVAKSGMLTGAMPIGIGDFERLQPTFDARGWDSVDPQKDSVAAIMDIGSALDTRTRILAERGLNFRKVVKKLAEEQKILEAAGVQISAFQPKVSATAETEQGTDGGKPDEEEPAADGKKKAARALHIAGQ